MIRTSILKFESGRAGNREEPSAFQKSVDSLVSGFVDQATDVKTLVALTSGGLAYRYGRIGVMGLPVGSYCNTPLRIASIALGLGSEVTAFEFTNRFLTT